MAELNFFEQLNTINCNDHTEEKNGLTYLSWAWAWGEFKKKFPRSYYTIYENKDGLNYHHDGNTAWVKTGVTLVTEDGYENEAIEYLPIMDNRNRSMPLASIDSFAVNKSIQRSLTKAVARHGLGLYIYAGEDLPETVPPTVDELVEMVNKVNSREEFEAVYRTAQSYKLDTNADFRKAALLMSKKYPKPEAA